MEIKFDVYFKKNLGTLCKDNEVDLDGKEAYINLDLSLVDRLEVNYSVGGTKYTDEVTIKDIDNKEILIPFKSDVVKKGLNEFEVVAYMKNGDVKVSQTYTYNIEKGIGSGKQAGTGGSSDGHTHSNLNILNSISQTKVNEWNNKANANHTHNVSEIAGLDNISIDLSNYYTKSETYNRNEIDNKIANMGTGGNVDLSNYYTKSETDEAMSNKANKIHEHNEYLTEHQDISHKADKVDTYTKVQTDSKISEEIAKIEVGDKHTHSNLTVLNSITQTKVNEWNNKADSTHSHSEYASKSHTHNASEIEGLENIDIDLSDYYTKSETDEVVNNKADKVHTHSQYLTELPTHTHNEYLTEHQDISHKADKVDTYTKVQTDSKISEEIAKAQLGGDNEVDLSAYATKNYVDDEIAKIEVGDKHTHSNLSVLNNITQTKVNEWNGKANASHTHSDYANKTHTHTEYASSSHTHNYADVSHNHSEYALSNHTHNYASSSHTHSDYADKTHTHSTSDISNLSSYVSSLITDDVYINSLKSTIDTLSSELAKVKTDIEALKNNSGGANIPVTDITCSEWDVSLQVGQTKQITASVVPSNATNKLIHWYSDNASVATVSSNGLITAKGVGYSKVTATTDDGGYKYDIHVNVTASSGGGSSSNLTTDKTSYTINSTEMLEISYTTSVNIPSSCAWELRQNGTYLCSAYRDTSTGKIVCYTGGLSVGTHNNITLVVKEYQTDIAVSNVFSITVSDSSSSGGGGSEGGGGSGGANIYLEPSSLVFNSGTQYESKYFNVIGVSESDNVTFETNNSLVCNVRKLAYNRCEVIALANGSTNVSATFGSNKLDCYVSISNMGSDSNVEEPISLPERIDTVAWHNQTFYISYSTNKEATLHYLDKNDGRGYVRVYPTNSYTNYSLQVDPITTTEPTHSWKLKVTDNRGNEAVSTVAITVMGLPTDGGSTPPSNGDNNPISNEYELSCTSEYILDKMYPMGQSHEAIPNGNITVPDGQVNWKYKSRWENQDRPYAMSHSCGQSGCPVTGAFQALGCWSNIYRVEGTPFTQNTGVEMKDIKVYGWYNGQWELIQHLPVPNGNFYAESFNGDTNRYFGDSVKQSSTSKTIILREANKINSENCMYHPFSNVKAFDVKYQYIYTCIDLRKVKWDENGIDDRDQTHYCSNCGGDWWLKEGLMFHDSWQHNKGVAQPKIIEITNEWRRFSMTTVPQGWSNGFPTGV